VFTCAGPHQDPTDVFCEDRHKPAGPLARFRRWALLTVGGAPAGCVLAVRAGKDRGCTGVLIEAGLANGDSDLESFADPDLDRGIQLRRTRIMGGCSATNDQRPLRPTRYPRTTATGLTWGFRLEFSPPAICSSTITTTRVRSRDAILRHILHYFVIRYFLAMASPNG
jgi:hypothetical protein